MTLPVNNLVAPLLTEPTTWLVGPIASTYKNNETITLYSLKGLYQVDSSGNPTTIPLGTSGPFVIQVDSEQILCSAANYNDNKVTIYASSQGNGRGYNGTTIAKHEIGGYGSGQVFRRLNLGAGWRELTDSGPCLRLSDWQQRCRELASDVRQWKHHARLGYTSYCGSVFVRWSSRKQHHLLHLHHRRRNGHRNVGWTVHAKC